MASAPPPGLPPNIGSITSATLIGSLCNFFLFGTLVIQVYVYNVCFPKDRPAIKRLVYFVFLAMAVCTCLNAADVYYWYAAGFGDLEKFGEARFSPFYTPIMGSVIALIVQLFYCYRISVFRSNAVWFTAVIALASFVQAVGGMGGGIKAYIAANEQHDKVRTVLVYMWLVGDAVADILIAITMTHLLTKASELHTREVVRGVVRLVIETNAFSASVAIVGLILFAGLPTKDYFICPTLVLPGVYANTLLVLLNNRAMRDSHTDNDHVPDGTTAGGSGNTHPQVGGGGSGGGGGDVLDIRLGPFVAAPNRDHNAVTWGSTSLDLDEDDEFRTGRIGSGCEGSKPSLLSDTRNGSSLLFVSQPRNPFGVRREAHTAVIHSSFRTRLDRAESNLLDSFENRNAAPNPATGISERADDDPLSSATDSDPLALLLLLETLVPLVQKLTAAGVGGTTGALDGAVSGATVDGVKGALSGAPDVNTADTTGAVQDTAEGR
ncbi:hypothetical protein B0H11DRAFT_2187682 [Mycena galericulata]|nr:hypothetical protein B0H11DRAFT_2187682 [Mycena galericulata]